MKSILLDPSVRPAVALATVLLLLVPTDLAGASPHPTPSTEVVAIWHGQQVKFEYSSATTFYSCEDLGRRVLAILKALGAHESTTLRATCKGGEFSGRAIIELALVSAVEATPSNVERETTFDATERLIARVQGQELPTPNDIVRFPAQWQQIVLTKDPVLRIRYQDCELLQGMKEQLFPKLAIRLVPKTFRCDSAPSHVRPRIVVEALVAVRESKQI
jgi:hypothetical protein